MQSVNVGLVQPFHIDEDGKELGLSTLINIADSVLCEGLAEAAELERTIAELQTFTADPTTLVSLPRIFQGWGSRPS
ncbi:MAG TPA: hypothetical protein VGF59_18270 [Bryobacteraceae bacterium]